MPRQSRRLQDGTQEFSQTMGALNDAASAAKKDVARGKARGASGPVSRKQANTEDKNAYKQAKSKRRTAQIVNKLGTYAPIPPKPTKPKLEPKPKKGKK